ncbi:MAG: hypothetical protein IPG50_18335 [Myxococcales bacterium]|nr:hypothetical protein [Myxococcales bacterium]
MSALAFVATTIDVDPDLRMLSFGRDEDDVSLSLVGGDAPCTVEEVELWFGVDDGERVSGALERASLTDNELVLRLTPEGAAIVAGARDVHVTIDVADLDVELEATRRLLGMLFESDASRLTLAAPTKKPRKKASEPPVRRSPRGDSAAVKLLTLLTERGLIELDEGATIPDLAERVTPLLGLLPEKRAKKSVVALLFDDPSVAEVFAEEDMLFAIVHEFLG